LFGIADIDTRRLTRILPVRGAQNGCIVAGDNIDEAALAQAVLLVGLKVADLAKVVSATDNYSWAEGSWQLGKGHITPVPHHVSKWLLMTLVLNATF